VGKLFAWFDVGTDWRLGIDRFIRLCAGAIVANWVLDMLYVLPVDDSKSIIEFVKSSISFGGDDD
jgi:hypothetical protein